MLVVRDDDQNSTDLMKCIQSLQEKEEADGIDVGGRTTEGFFSSFLILLHFFLDFLRRHLARWHLWATRSDHPHIIIPAQAPEKRTSVFRRHGRECRLGPRRGKEFPFFRRPEFPRLDLRPGLRVNIVSLLTTRY